MGKTVRVKRWLDRDRQKKGNKCFGLKLFLGDSKPSSKFFDTIKDREEWFDNWVSDIEEGMVDVVTVKGRVSTQSRTLHWAINEYLQAGEREGWRNHTMRARKERLGKLAKILGDVPLKQIERHHVIEFIENAGTNILRKGWCSDAVAFLNWCGNEDQGRAWVPPYKFSKLKWTRLKEDEKHVGILEPGEAKLIMEGILPKYKAGMALSLFAGIRPMGELVKLRWEDIQFPRKRIVIDGSASKTRKRRVLTDLPDNLWAWLRAYKKDKGSILHSYAGFQQARKRAWKKYGITYPADAARHSFASYGYWRGEEWARRTMGHTDTSDMFHRIYVDAGPSKEESEEYFSIFPNPTAVQKIPG